MSADTWNVNCDCCNSTIDKLDQQKGVYIVGDSEEVCSEKCVKQILGEEEYKQAEEEWEYDGHSDSYYWTYWEQREV